MQQVLFHLPFTEGLFGMPDGVPLYGFGAMLFLCFVLTAMVWGPRRVAKVGMPKERLQDMAIVLFLTGIAGARVFYMIQYPKDFKDKNAFLAFFEIWNGGIVFYGGMIGATLGFVAFQRLILKKLNVSTWKLADAIAPLIALGLAVGRIGCYLNGCCWGQVACPECQPVPLSAALGEFPLLPAHARDQVVSAAGEGDRLPHIRGLQTSTGFSLRPFDPQSVVARVEPGSPAAAANLKEGDKVVTVNGQPNEADKGTDTLNKLVYQWPRGKKELKLTVEREGEKEPVEVAFTPKTVTFFPTQLYETISMGLLIGVMLAFQPFRRHDGQVMVVLMVGYGLHRFLNEAIRIEPTYALGLTASQWISVCIIVAAGGLELFLRRSQPPLPAGELPLGHGAVPVAG